MDTHSLEQSDKRPMLILLKSNMLSAAFLATLLGGLFFISSTLIEKYDRMNPSISVQGKATLYAEPDLAELQLGVQTGRQKTAQDAMETLQRGMDAILVSLTELDVQEKDIQTQSLWLNPAYDWIDGEQIFRGYEASQGLLIRLRDLSKVGLALTSATNAGANQVSGVNFRIEDFETLHMQAREKAIARAQQDAEELAMQLGVDLGKIVGFSESGLVDPSPYIGKGGNGYGGGGDTPIPTGQQEITAQVYISYKIK
ncbi:SIMPL domain-containing protein [Patescibacteria group bacterium]|nr:SIMPL domain-containing protein [Patescibacteria group bacterium]MBU2259211.1 SIMPL domain-containing protein [Patescibacteria group bacterium]